MPWRSCFVWWRYLWSQKRALACKQKKKENLLFFSEYNKKKFISGNENIQIFTRASHSWKYWCFHYTRWQYLWYSQQKSKYPISIQRWISVVTLNQRWIDNVSMLYACWEWLKKLDQRYTNKSSSLAHLDILFNNFIFIPFSDSFFLFFSIKWLSGTAEDFIIYRIHRIYPCKHTVK